MNVLFNGCDKNGRASNALESLKTNETKWPDYPNISADRFVLKQSICVYFVFDSSLRETKMLFLTCFVFFQMHFKD